MGRVVEKRSSVSGIFARTGRGVRTPCDRSSAGVPRAAARSRFDGVLACGARRVRRAFAGGASDGVGVGVGRGLDYSREEGASAMPWVILGLAIFGLIILVTGMFTVQQQSAAVVQRFGKFLRISNAGLNFKVPLVDTVAGRVNLRVQQLDVQVETKTLDNVFVKVMVSVQYYVLPDKIYDAFYRLQDEHTQITAFVFDVVRAQVPTINLDDVFEKKDEIAIAVKNELTHVMDDFGYGILKTLVTDIDPDPKVKQAMNEINAAQRLRIAANEKGEAERILKVKAAQAEAESKALQGKGIADQRKAIVEGLRESVDEFQKSIPGASPQDVMNLVLMTQYFDTLKDIGASSVSSTILIPHSPGHMADLGAQLRDAMITAGQVAESTNRAAGHGQGHGHGGGHGHG